MRRRDNDVGRNNNSGEYGELNKADIGYAVKRFLNDAHDYAEHEEYVEIKRIMNPFHHPLQPLLTGVDKIYTSR
jgi:hypothetical protein